MLEQMKDRPQSGTIGVLIVEDYKLTRLGLRSILNSSTEIDVLGEAEDGEKGIAMVKQLHPDVVLMDLGLPGMNGIEATHQIKSFDENIKVIVYTSHERENEVIAALGAGANAYCLKDSSPETLLNTVKVVSEGSAWLDPAIANIALKMFQSGSLSLPEPEPQLFQGTPQLSDQEVEVLRLLVEGKSNSEIAQELLVNVSTAKDYVCDILHKLSVHDRVQAAVKAIKEGIL